ncbi:MAG: tRNA adenosine(34) deaminase TadA [Candidatus Omnitrophota bacterium]|nr:tRNA adenosine(34) deaminase TadA [Candidatus Omnitrophota bacterium]
MIQYIKDSQKITKDQLYMQAALAEAEAAASEDEVPVGAVIVHREGIIARAHNQIERLCDPTAHAEILAVTQAAAFLKKKWLVDCALYVTIEPCLMCAGALVLARLGKLVFGASDSKTGAFGSKADINTLGLNHRIRVRKGVFGEECGQLINGFFLAKRKLKKV